MTASAATWEAVRASVAALREGHKELSVPARTAIARATSRLEGLDRGAIRDELKSLEAVRASHQPGDLAALAALALFGVRRGEIEPSEGLAIAERIAEDFASPERQLYLADAYELAGQYEAALDNLNEVRGLEGLTDSFGFFFRLGVLNYNLKRFEEARRAYERAVELKPTATAHLYLADAYRALDQRDLSRRHYLEALRREPTLVDALRGYWSFAPEGLLRETTFDAILSRLAEAPPSPLPLNRWLRLPAWILLRWRYRRHPEDARLHFMLGYTALLRRRFAVAEERLTFSSLLAPRGDQEAAAVAALAKGFQGRIPEARTDLLQLRQSWTDAAPYDRWGNPELQPSILISPFVWEPKLVRQPHAEEVYALIEELYGPGHDDEGLIRT